MSCFFLFFGSRGRSAPSFNPFPNTCGVASLLPAIPCSLADSNPWRYEVVALTTGPTSKESVCGKVLENNLLKTVAVQKQNKGAKQSDQKHYQKHQT